MKPRGLKENQDTRKTRLKSGAQRSKRGFSNDNAGRPHANADKDLAHFGGGGGGPSAAEGVKKRALNADEASQPKISKSAKRGRHGIAATFSLQGRWACFSCGKFVSEEFSRCSRCRAERKDQDPTQDWKALIKQTDPDGKPYSDHDLAFLFTKYVDSKRTITVHDFPQGMKEEELLKHFAPLGPKAIWWTKLVTAKDPSQNYYVIKFQRPDLAEKAEALGAPFCAGRNLRVRTYKDIMEDEEVQKLAQEALGKQDLSVWNEGKKAKLRPVKWSQQLMDDNPITKDFRHALQYDSHNGNKFETYREFYTTNNLAVLPAPIEPVLQWEEINFGKEINDALRAFPAPTHIQSLAWPAMLAGRDCIGLAKTGSGKTLAFLLPAIIHIRAQSCSQGSEGPIALILAPVRELVNQIAQEAHRFKNAGFSLASITGGHGVKGRFGQVQVIHSGADMLVAAPKRLATFVECGVLNLNRVTFLVIDEADRMLDLGFNPQIKELVSQLRPDRQASMFTATWGRQVHTMALDYLTHDVAQIIACGGMEESAMANPNVEQRFIFNMSGFDRTEEVVKLVRQLKQDMQNQQAEDSRILIFCSRTRTADDVCLALQAEWENTFIFHGELNQAGRESNYDKFAADSKSLLVATDIAGRGLDIPGLPYVINVQMPVDILQYIHRIGRTGRAGRKGVAITFLDADHRQIAPDLIRILENVGQSVPKELIDLRDRPDMFFSSEFEEAPIFGHGRI